MTNRDLRGANIQACKTEMKIADELADEQAVDVLKLLSSSETRIKLYFHLLDRSPESVPRRELINATGASRSTISNFVDAFGEYNIVEESQGEVRLTTVGELLENSFRSLLRKSGAVGRLKPFLQQLSQSDIRETNFHENIPHMKNVSIVEQNTDDPLAPLNTYLELLDSTSDVREISPFFITSNSYDNIFEYSKFSGDTIVEKTIFNQEQNDDQESKQISDFSEYSGINIYSCDISTPEYTISIFDDCVCTIAYGDNIVLLHSENDNVRDWALDMYGDYMENSSKHQF